MLLIYGTKQRVCFLLNSNVILHEHLHCLRGDLRIKYAEIAALCALYVGHE